LGELGGLQAVLDAWAAYPELLSSALWSFSQVLGAIKNTILFGELGAIPKIIKVYNEQKGEDEDLQVACLETFALVARLPANKMMFCETGVVEKAIAGIQKYTTDNAEEDQSSAGDTVLTAGLEFLAQVATNDAKAQRFIGSKKGVKAILGALETFSGVRSITEKACFAIQALSDDETNLKKLNKVRKEKPDLIQLSHSTSFIFCKACGRGDFPYCPDSHGLLTDVVDAKAEKPVFKCCEEKCEHTTAKAPWNNGCQFCKSTDVHAQLIRIEKSEVKFANEYLAEEPQDVGLIKCLTCHRLEFPGCGDHGFLSVRIGDHVKCVKCAISTDNSPPWRVGCRWCKMATAKLLVKLTSSEGSSLFKGLGVEDEYDEEGEGDEEGEEGEEAGEGEEGGES